MFVAAKHQVDAASFSTGGMKKLVEMKVSVQCPSSRHATDDPCRCREELLDCTALFSHSALLDAVGIVISQPVVLDIAVERLRSRAQQANIAVTTNPVQTAAVGKTVDQTVRPDASSRGCRG